ncbi:MAG: ATP-binding protein [Oscillospiraceae bacterium]
MTKKICETIIKISTITLLASIIIILGILYDYFISMQFSQQKNELELAAQGVILNGEEYFVGINTKNYRITWIENDGKVLFDSKINANDMENHIKREEFMEALKNGYGESQRKSSTFAEKTMYSAKKLPDGSVLRISSTQISIISLVFGIAQPILFVSLCAVGASIFFARKVSIKTVSPLNRLDLENPLSNEVYEELSPLLVRIDRQNKKIKSQLDDLAQKNKEITYVTEHVSDGIIMLNKKGNVISANKKAKELLHCSDGNYYLDFCRNLEYKRTVEMAQKGEKSSCTLKIGDLVYRIFASCIHMNNDDIAVFMFISDVTDEENAQQMRREFTANVSHELKTPLSAIMGSAEIIKNGIVKQEDIPHFATKIYEEASRLLNLIQDIIKLSRLDEVGLKAEFSPIILGDIAQAVKNELCEKALKKEISIDLICNKSRIRGYLPVIHEMIYNLCDNAIIYNNKGGKVNIEIETKGNQGIFSITDTGIGIAKNEISHIFERFYRVDKSHSKETGGTGLGLSIVKHGAELHRATINIDSEIGIGTKITVIFPLL